MAKNSDIALRQDVIYSVYIRNHTEEGTFLSVIPDLERIRALGTDIIWFMPIHPIGEKGKKGTLGCPYANRDYRSVNPCYGTKEDFITLADAIHALGMKVIIDVVYNHTSPDAVLTEQHPEFYYRRPDGSFGNKTAEWTDVIDLDYSCRGLWDYQIESLKMWAEIVDGFRCDVASCVPVDFWKEARAAVEKVRPGCIWLGETVHTDFNLLNRILGYTAASDSEMFEAFDVEYDYDIRTVFDRYLRGEISLSHYIDQLNLQEGAYQDNYNKLRCLENHDRDRICSYVKDERQLRNWTAMLYFLKGTTLIYAGQEFEDDHLPSLFEKDLFFRRKDFSDFLRTMYGVKKSVLSSDDYFLGSADDERDIAVLQRNNGKDRKLGVFSLRGRTGEISTDFPDGVYENRISGEEIRIRGGKLEICGEPVAISVSVG